MEPKIHEQSDETYKAAICLYYNESTRRNKFGKMSTLMINTIATQPVNSLMERAIISSFAFFIDKGFKIVVDVTDFVPNLQPTVPNNWKNSINNVVSNNTEWSNAIYFIRKRNQTFHLTFSWNSLSREVIVSLIHTTRNHKPLDVHLVESELNGLSDGEHDTIFAMGIGEKFSKEMKDAIKKATQDLPPSSTTSPL